jgi:hypothetical protein
VRGADAGTYQVRVSNGLDVKTSASAELLVVLPPSIISHPQGQAPFIGGTAQFTVLATGTGPLSYQWRYYDRLINGATSPTLVLTNLSASESGEYSVQVSNPAGFTNTLPAVLVVQQAPTVSLEAAPQISDGKFRITLSVPQNGMFTLYGSDDLQTWTVVTNFILQTATVDYVDPGLFIRKSRFYKVSGQ